MATIPSLLKEMKQESETTRKMLSAIPEDKLDWQPHRKSMTIRALATHIAELPTWVTMTIHTDELDFAKEPYNPPVINSREDILAFFEQSLENGYTNLEQADESQFGNIWTLRNGDEIYVAVPKSEMIRSTYSQVVHHRAQLGVYLRLLNVPIPGSYGPSADEMEAMAAATA